MHAFAMHGFFKYIMHSDHSKMYSNCCFMQATYVLIMFYYSTVVLPVPI